MAEPYFVITYPNIPWSIDLAKEDLGMYIDTIDAYSYPSRVYTLPSRVIVPNASYIGIVNQLSTSLYLEAQRLGPLITNIRTVGNTIQWDTYSGGGRGAWGFTPKIQIFRRINV